VAAAKRHDGGEEKRRRARHWREEGWQEGVLGGEGEDISAWASSAWHHKPTASLLTFFLLLPFYLTGPLRFFIEAPVGRVAKISTRGVSDR